MERSVVFLLQPPLQSEKNPGETTFQRFLLESESFVTELSHVDDGTEGNDHRGAGP